jgi:hypothetical protein
MRRTTRASRAKHGIHPLEKSRKPKKITIQDKHNQAVARQKPALKAILDQEDSGYRQDA